MSLGIGYALAQTFSLSGATHTATIVDEDGTRTNLDLNGGTTERFYLTKLSAAGSGTATDPWEFLAKMQAMIRGANARWTLSLLASGKVQIQYSGTGTGTITWGGSCYVQMLLGYTSDISIASGGTQVSEYHPSHIVYAVAAADDGWQNTPGRFTGHRMPDGTVYGWGDGLAGRRREMTLKLCPRDYTTGQAIEADEPGVTCGTPMFGQSNRWLNPASSEAGQPLPWGINDMQATAGGKRCGFTDDFANLIASPSTCDVVYLEPEALTAKSSLSVPGMDTLRDVGPIGLSWAETAAL